MRLSIRLLLCGGLIYGQVRIPGPGGAAGTSSPAVALISSACFTSGSSAGGTTSAVNMTGANFFIIGAITNGGSTYAFSDSVGNTYATLAQDTGNAYNGQFAYAERATPNAAQTFTVTTGSPSSYATFCVLGFSGVKTSASYDAGTNAATNTGAPAASLQAAGVTPGAGRQVVATMVGISCCGSLTVSSIDSSFVIPSPGSTGAGLFTMGMAYLIQSSGAMVQPKWTVSGSTQTLKTVIAAFSGQ